MTRLSETEKQDWRAGTDRIVEEPGLNEQERFVAPTPEARARYIHFATQASMLFKGEKPIPYTGNHWKL